MVYAWRWSVTFIPYNSCILEKSVPGTASRTRWTKSMACIFPWDLYLRRCLKFILILQKSVTPTICNCGNNVFLSWFFRYIGFYSKTDNQGSDVWLPRLQLKAVTLRIFFKLSRLQFTIYASKPIYYKFFLALYYTFNPSSFCYVPPPSCSMQLYV